LDQRSVKSQQRRGPDGNRDFQYALRRHEYRTQTQQDTVKGVERRRLLSSSVQDQQLMLQKERFGDDCAGTPRSHSPDRRDDEMSEIRTSQSRMLQQWSRLAAFASL
jgi:hypothetical protein